jgi:hypothetical protein
VREAACRAGRIVEAAAIDCGAEPAAAIEASVIAARQSCRPWTSGSSSAQGHRAEAAEGMSRGEIEERLA